MSAKFGPAGSGESFKQLGYKHSIQIPKYLVDMNLDHFEYQCGRGVNISLEKAQEFGIEAKNNGITISLHAPYYISMSSVDEEKRLNSVNYILQSARAVKAMGGNRIVVHTGSCGKISREQALELAKDTMRIALDALMNEHLEDIHICPETMGKINQLGTLEEVIELCRLNDSIIPCIDFGHLNARTFGSLKTIDDFKSVLDSIENSLGAHRSKYFHSHFSKIEYTSGGEKCHLTFDDNKFGPDYEPLLEVIVSRGLAPTIVCESAGTQPEDALKMKQYYLSLL